VGFFDKVKEHFRDKKRDNMCAHLRKLWIDAEMAERGRAEESIDTGSYGLIDIRKGPIRWVNVRRVHTGGGPGGGSTTDYFVDYGVPDPRLGGDCPRAFIKSVRVRTLPLFGRVIDVCWEGQDCGLGIINHLSSDGSLKDPIVRSHDVDISANGEHTCWIIRTKPSARLGPSRELWDCYESIARHLLAEWPPRAP
jgi:hypothetical protein